MNLNFISCINSQTQHLQLFSASISSIVLKTCTEDLFKYLRDAVLWSYTSLLTKWYPASIGYYWLPTAVILWTINKFITTTSHCYGPGVVLSNVASVSCQTHQRYFQGGSLFLFTSINASPFPFSLFINLSYITLWLPIFRLEHHSFLFWCVSSSLRSTWNHFFQISSLSVKFSSYCF